MTAAQAVGEEEEAWSDISVCSTFVCLHARRHAGLSAKD